MTLFAFAGAGEDMVYRPVSVSFVPGFSSNAGDARRVHSNFSWNIIGGELGRLSGLELSGVFALEHDRVFGVQAAGVFNLCESDVWGVQSAGVFNLNRGAFTGVRAAGVFNMNDAGVRGVEAAGVFNLARDGVTGVQSAGVFNIAGERSIGVQAAGVWNLAEGRFTGAQLAGVLNLVDENLSFGQVSGVVNVAGGEVAGAQLAGVLNVAEAVRGVQVSGVVNVAERVKGVQYGLVNVAGKAQGVQLGLVNISEDIDGVPIGLVTVVQNGMQHLDVWADEVAPVNIGFRSGSRYIYNMYYVGFPYYQEEPTFMTGLGIGGHVPYRDFFVNFDVLGASLRPWSGWSKWDRNSVLGRFRLLAGWQALPWLAIQAGPALSFCYSDLIDSAKIPLFDFSLYKSGRERVWPGLTLGVQFF